MTPLLADFTPHICAVETVSTTLIGWFSDPCLGRLKTIHHALKLRDVCHGLLVSVFRVIWFRSERIGDWGRGNRRTNWSPLRLCKDDCHVRSEASMGPHNRRRTMWSQAASWIPFSYKNHGTTTESTTSLHIFSQRLGYALSGALTSCVIGNHAQHHHCQNPLAPDDDDETTSNPWVASSK